jgi:hypothetical protein
VHGSYVAHLLPALAILSAATGVALLSSLAAARAGQLLSSGHGAALALTDGYRLAFTVGAGLWAVALVRA